MGFAKLRRLKRGAVPNIYEENLGDSQRAERAQHRENKRIVRKLLQQSETAVATAAVASDTVDANISDESVNNKENSLTEANLSDIPTTSTPRKVFYYDSSLQEVEELEAKL
ncbi:PREDICTED: uncharacterized protein LOC108371936 [Rhagoletis zephyria]|uniref:uncharacterized protein LOC108371936 n=1 Tax=Rhagoletis zephyria TaxID=28612 RepID=UPI00081121B0|nr:PREDICTED: uncharacterized protein LOC108371936 [Rhagoletis zephyria]